MIRTARAKLNPVSALAVRLDGSLGLGLCLLLAGCAHTPLPPTVGVQPLQALDRFYLEGRILVRTEAQSFSGGIRWRHDPARDEILITSPLGQGVAKLAREDGQVTLKNTQGQTYVAASAEELLETVLGVRLPLNGMVHWLCAQPKPGAAYELEYDSAGRVMRLAQDGWRLEYGRYRVHGQRRLPGRIFAQRNGALEFRLVVDSWQVR